MIKKEKKF